MFSKRCHQAWVNLQINLESMGKPRGRPSKNKSKNDVNEWLSLGRCTRGKLKTRKIFFLITTRGLQEVWKEIALVNLGLGHGRIVILQGEMFHIRGFNQEFLGRPVPCTLLIHMESLIQLEVKILNWWHDTLQWAPNWLQLGLYSKTKLRIWTSTCNQNQRLLTNRTRTPEFHLLLEIQTQPSLRLLERRLHLCVL